MTTQAAVWGAHREGMGASEWILGFIRCSLDLLLTGVRYQPEEQAGLTAYFPSSSGRDSPLFSRQERAVLRHTEGSRRGLALRVEAFAGCPIA